MGEDFYSKKIFHTNLLDDCFPSKCTDVRVTGHTYKSAHPRAGVLELLRHHEPLPSNALLIALYMTSIILYTGKGNQ